MNDKIHNLITQQEFINLGHIIASNSNNVFAIANNEGLLRIIESADLIKKRNEKISFEYEKIKHSLNSEERQNTYKLAKNAEMKGDHEMANELYNSLDIEYNSKQIVSEKEEIINE